MMIYFGNRVNARWLLTVFLFLYRSPTGDAQVVNSGSPSFTATSKITKPNNDLFGTAKCFIKNIGQYGDTLVGNNRLGQIIYGYEGLGMPVLFTKKGLMHLQRKIEGPTEEEREHEEKETKGRHLKEEPEEQKAIDKTITMEWLNANPNVLVTEEEQSSAYHTYPSVKGKAFGYKKIIYKNLYPGIDVVYSFNANNKAGFEYSLLVQPGADLNKVAMKFGGDVKKIITDNRGNLVIKSDIDGIKETIPVTYYGEEVFNKSVGDVKTNYSISGNEIHFLFPQDYDHSKAIVIDPFVTSTGNLIGLNAGKAKDVDFDYAGNIYVTGGGNSTIHQLAKFDATGALQWTFSGSLINPSWTFGSYWGGWMVEKPTGNVYLGQGFNPITGFQVIQISTTGLYNNYITAANPNFREAWKMIWSCNNGSPQILVAGGGTNSNINFGVFIPPSTTISSLNVTGIPYTGSAGWAQDIVDFIIDPANNDMYTIYGSLIGNPSLTNKMYKNTAPYSGASVAWTVPSGFTSVQEIANRPYLVGGEIDNSANIFAINASYLYYWDGKNLKAFDKATGNGVGTPLVTANTTLMQGGIIADACNNVFVGDASGIIKVYKFTGTVFNDAAAPDITIPGFSGKATYDLAYDDAKKLLYVSGDGFVGSFDISSYCTSTQYTLNVVPNCANASATFTVSPAPPAGSSVTYLLSAGGTQLASNTTGVFTGLSPNVSYTVIATINLACSGTRATTTFVLPGPTINTAQINTNCASATGSLTATGSGTTAPYSYSINGVSFQASGLFTGLAAGVYTLTVKDANGCVNTKVITILNSNGPTLTYTSTNADCGNNNGTITASVTGGTSPYTYSITGTTFQSGNFFTGLIGGTYTLTVKDATGCTNAAVVTITSSPSPLITAIPAAATCGSSNGSITAFGSGGTGALQYSINGNIFQAGNVFTNLTPGSYTVTVKDANGCSKNTSVTIANSPAPIVTTTTTPASCNNINGTITATGSGGIAPLQYSINGITFQSSNIFTGLATGPYTITVKDATGCTNFISVNVGSTGGPTATATSTVSACNSNTGTITASASGGVPAYQYSSNGSTFQGSNIFSGLAAGNYVVYVRDASGCIGTVSIVVGNSAGPTLSAVTTATACNANTGTIVATAGGGTPAYQYSLDGITYQVTNSFTALATGAYTVFVKDNNGCIKTTDVNITNVAGLTLAVSTITSACNGNSGVITATATGGTAPLQYSVNGTTYQASSVFNGLTPGIYNVYVKDANGCIVKSPATVGSVAGPSLSINSTDATCGGANGIINATGSGGLPPFTYSLNGTIFQSSGTFLNVAAGSYNFILKDAAGCTASQTVVINNIGTGPGITSFTVRTSGAYPCNGDLGRITNPRVNGSNCNNCTFSLNSGPFIPNNTQLFLNLNAGTYTVTAMDANGCTSTILATINLAPLSTATSTVTATACNATNGSITLTGVGPNTPYHASISGIGGPWITFDPTYTFTGLAPGNYTIILSDDESFDTGPPIDPGGCLDTIQVIVPSIGGPSLSLTQTNGSCGSNTGSITATGSAGTAPYTYSLDGINYFTSGVFSNLAPGNYIVTVQDATGCVNIAQVTLTSSSAPSLIADIQSSSCSLNNGMVTATGTGGTAPLQYSINGTTFQNSNVFTNLAPGNYTLYVKDAAGCYGTLPVTVVNTPLPKVTAFTIAATCSNNDGSIVATGSQGSLPYVFSINGTVYQSSNTFSTLAAGFYTVYIKDASGCVTTSGVSVGNVGSPTFTSITTPATCGNANGSITTTATGGSGSYQYSKDGISFQASNIFSGLSPGNYTVFVKDVNGCLVSKTVLVANTNGPQTLTATIINAACGGSNGSITASASGGTAPLQYSINGITYQASNTFTNIAAGNYMPSVKDANGCIKTLPVQILNLPPPSLTATSSPSSCGSNDGTITAITAGGTLPLTYSKNGITFQSSNIFLNLAGGAYTVTVKDSRGCIATFDISVSIAGTSTTPTFNPVVAICSGATLTPLPTTSTNGITGTWSPALNNTATTTYTFAPGTGQCASTTTMTITVNPSTTPTFNAVAAICSGAPITPLPTTSTNGITGTWSPVLNNTATTTYTFTPGTGQCATTATMTITVNPATTPTFNAVAAICAGTTLSPLPTTSTNGITGTWSPALNNTATTTYTFTPGTGQCASISMMTITVNPTATPTFNAVAAICSGATLSPLPTTSTNGITGKWSPALNNIATTTYIFTPGTGQCATTTTMTITVNPPITPTFNAVAAICSGAILAPLPTTSTNGITGTWSPVLNSTTTTTYTFTPGTGQCATTTTLTITVSPVLSATINCGVSTSSSVTFTWAAVSGATGYNVSYQVNSNPVVNVGAIGNVLSYQVTGLTGGDNVSITVTPTGGAGSCFTYASKTCTATPCTPPTASISYATPFCTSVTGSQAVTLTGTGAFTGGTFSAHAGLTLNPATGAITPNTSTAATYTVSYSIAASGGCPGATATTAVTIDGVVTPAFSPVAAICSGAILAPLPTISTNGITGTWSPALNNTATTTYIFTPGTGQCALTTTMTITVNTATTPTFNAVAAICSGTTLSPLPTTSTNGITGSWSPSLNNTTTTTYTFTPATGQCASTATMTIAVNPAITPTFNPVAPICSGATLSPLPTTSTNSITGSWSPALNNTATTTYTFTPGTGQCAAITTMTITVNTATTPTFDAVAAICSGTTLPPLPTTSTNGITGSWSPSLNNTTTTSYTFTPATGQCASTATMTVAVNPATTPTFNPVAPICSGATLSPLPTTSTNGITGTWSPALNNTATTTYTFTPGTGQCATTATMTIAVNPVLSAIINCGVSTTSSVTFTWAAVNGANGYSISYQVNSNPLVNVGAIGNVLTYMVTGLAGGDNVTITVTPTGAANNCFTSSAATCTATACTPPTATISYATPFCASTSTAQSVILTGTGIFTGGTFSAPAGLTLNSTTGAIMPNTSNPGTFTVNYKIAASGGCPGVTATTSVTINSLTTPTFNPVIPICSGATLSPLPTTSLNGITGTWSPALNNTGTTTYTFTPAAGQCASIATMVIKVTPLPASPAISITQPTCTLSSGGVTITSPTSGLTFSLDGGAFNIYPVTGYSVSPGTHTLKAQDVAGCISAVTNININSAPAPPTAIAISTVDATCGTNNGSLTIGDVTGGTAPYSYSFNGSAFTSTLIYTNLPAGAYSIAVKDANGCSFTTPASINNSNGATVTAIATNASCGASNGSVIATGAGGAAPYQYSINGITFQVSNVFSNLAANSYTVTIKDANNCTNIATAFVSNSGGATVSTTATNASCGASNGSVTATGSGGATPYQYSINGTTFQASNIFSNLAANTYTVTIKDANNCTNTTTVVVSNSGGAAVSATATNASCGASNGSVTATGSGGATPYQYSINGTIFQASNIFLNLAANTYTVTIKDANNCTGTTTIVVQVTNSTSVNAGPDIRICEGSSKQLAATANSTSLSWSPQFGLSDPFVLNPVASPTVTTKYVLTVTQGQCSKSDTIIVFVDRAPVANAGKDMSVCLGKALQLSGSGGLIYQWYPPDYLSNAVISNPDVVSPPIGALEYTLNVTDANGCKSLKADTVSVTILPLPKVFAGDDTSITVNQPLQLHAADINSAGFKNYLWSPSVGLNNPSTQNPVAVLSTSTRYVLTATTAEGCIATDDIKITVFQKPELYVPSGFTPNNDGLNDVLKIIPVGIKQLKYFKIFNRWGELVFNTTDPAKGWDGSYKAQGQNTYVFIWIAEAIDFSGKVLYRKGTVTLIR